MGIAFKLLLFLSPWTDMGYVASGDDGFIFTHEASVKTQILRFFLSRSRAKNDKIVEC